METEMNIKVYASLPCEAEIFTINNIKASLSDFGEVRKENSGWYSCTLKGFIAKLPTEDILKKYQIDLHCYDKVVKELDNVFYHGSCSCCR